MKLKFKEQVHQVAAVKAVVDCFAGQPRNDRVTYLINQGSSSQRRIVGEGFKNSNIQLKKHDILENIRNVQRRQNLPVSRELTSNANCNYNLDVEMETGTGKTYCYIKTIFEMNRKYGWSKFIIMVPNIAIREGVYKSLQITADHFMEFYKKRARFFIYNSKRLHELESFSSNAGINIMIINIQAFNAAAKKNASIEARKIFRRLEDFQSRRPIDVISSNRPILILDEPQNMSGTATIRALEKFKPLMILRYSATHKKQHNKVHCLDALDAFNQKLVKKIVVRGIHAHGLPGSAPYMYLEGIEVSSESPIARIEIEVKQASGDKQRQVKRVGRGRDLEEASKGNRAYRGYEVLDIKVNEDFVEFLNGEKLYSGQAAHDLLEEDERRIQIRETIRAHLEKEQTLYAKGVKVLSLFFIDSVPKYRDYGRDDTKGIYARIFEEEYQQLLDKHLKELSVEEYQEYRAFLQRDLVGDIHKGYFSIDKKSNHFIDSPINNAGLSDDEDAYNLILRDKERLLSLKEPVRFIFSHSALREGWDNPNVFTMCMLKHSDNKISRRQEIGRGLRLSVNQSGERMDSSTEVHDINVLTVIANESYEDFVAKLQKEISEELAYRPRKANEAYFMDKILFTEQENIIVTQEMAAQIEFYLIRNDYIDHKRQILERYHQHKNEGILAPLPMNLEEYAPQIFDLIDSVFSADALARIVANGRQIKKNSLNNNFRKKEFQKLWARINKKAIYQVQFNSNKLIENCIHSLNEKLKVTLFQYTIKSGEQTETVNAFSEKEREIQISDQEFSASNDEYDLLHEIAEGAMLTRQTVASILSGIKEEVFKKFKISPDQFISEVVRLIKKEKAILVIEELAYDTTGEQYDKKIFKDAEIGNDFSKATRQLNKHIFERAIVDSQVERKLAYELDNSNEVVVYAKLPSDFIIPTPVGDYNPDWAISFKRDAVRHIYFVAETKGSSSPMQLRWIEQTKIDCANKFFAELASTQRSNKVRYGVVSTYEELIQLVEPIRKTS